MNMIIQPSANDVAVDLFASLDPKAVALLLDVDGTLIEIGPSPYEVYVPEELIAMLRRLYDVTGGALALVSGRPIHDIDRLFEPLELPAVGGHGAETRLRRGEKAERIIDLPDDLRRHLAAAATPENGVVVEDKGYSVALHYRKAPHQAESLRKHVAAGRAAFPKEMTQLLLGKAMFEVKRPGVSKGEAVRELMTQPPFAGRTPVFLGDDVTDESVFEMLPQLGGKGFGVGRHFPALTGIFASPSEVRRALQRLAVRNTASAP